jgi:uncharacterized protein
MYEGAPIAKIIDPLTGRTTHLLLITCGWLILVSLAWPASFDCKKATTATEKAICANPELSTLDGEMANQFSVAMSLSSDKGGLQHEQRKWIKRRDDTCGGKTQCLKVSYTQRIADLKTNEVCGGLQRELDMQRPDRSSSLAVESLPVEGGDTEYPNLDIDGDGIGDHVIRSCGSGDMPCSLFIDLSAGGKLELPEVGRFYLGRYKSKLYVILGHDALKTPAYNRNKRSVYAINPTDIILVCPKI